MTHILTRDEINALIAKGGWKVIQTSEGPKEMAALAPAENEDGSLCVMPTEEVLANPERRTFLIRWVAEDALAIQEEETESAGDKAYVRRALKPVYDEIYALLARQRK
jgi:hypothetical protein